MKTFKFLLLFIIILTTSCTKDEDLDYSYSDLVGTWQVTKFDIIPIDYSKDFDWNQNMDWNDGNECRLLFNEKNRFDIINKINDAWMISARMYDVLEVSNRGFFTLRYEDYSYIIFENDGTIVVGFVYSKLNKIYQMHCKKISDKLLRY